MCRECQFLQIINKGWGSTPGRIWPPRPFNQDREAIRECKMKCWDSLTSRIVCQSPLYGSVSQRKTPASCSPSCMDPPPEGRRSLWSGPMRALHAWGESHSSPFLHLQTQHCEDAMGLPRQHNGLTANMSYQKYSVLVEGQYITVMFSVRSYDVVYYRTVIWDYFTMYEQYRSLFVVSQCNYRLYLSHAVACSASKGRN